MNAFDTTKFHSVFHEMGLSFILTDDLTISAESGVKGVMKPLHREGLTAWQIIRI